jgi:hypothetical protein
MYEHDVFVSYAHVDDKPDVNVTDGWVTTLVRSLRGRLAMRLGRAESFTLWKDEQLRGNTRFSDEILGAIRSSATLLVILSKGYLESKWGEMERKTFLDALRGQVDSNRRIFVVERDKVARTRRPPEFDGVLGYCFWEERDGKAARILGDPLPDPRLDRDYYDAVNRLSFELAEQIERLRPTTKDPNPAAGPQPPATSAAVYLAEVTDDLNRRRESVRQYLCQAGLRVLPEGWLPRDPAAFREAVARDIGNSKLFVQLLSELTGPRGPDLPTGYTGLQYELARAAGKPLFQWRPALDLTEVDDPDHWKLLEGATVYVEAIEEFKARVVREATKKPPVKPPIAPGVFVFVNSEREDQCLAETVSATLNRFAIDNALPFWDAESVEDFRDDLVSKLEVCDTFMVIYGKGNNLKWVRRQLDESLRIKARREKPFQVIGIYEGPPETKPVLNYNLRNVRVINCRTGHDEGALKTYLDNLLTGNRP